MTIPVVFSVDHFLNHRKLLVDTLNGIMAEGLSVLTVINALSAEITVHPVSPQYNCRKCNEPQKNKQSGLVLNPILKIKTNDGGYRTVAPAQSIENLEPVVSSLTGVVSPVNCLTGDDEALSIYATVFSKIPRKNGLLKSDDFIQYSLGKGISKEQSKISALSEAIERYNAMYDGTEECTYAKGDQLDAMAFFPGNIKAL
jgi:hypothetical protein